MDYKRRWLLASAEYQNYDSTFSQYQAWRFLQSFDYQPSSASRVGVDLNQTFYRYQGNLDQDQYHFFSPATTSSLNSRSHGIWREAMF